MRHVRGLEGHVANTWSKRPTFLTCINCLLYSYFKMSYTLTFSNNFKLVLVKKIFYTWNLNWFKYSSLVVSMLETLTLAEGPTLYIMKFCEISMDKDCIYKKRDLHNLFVCHYNFAWICWTLIHSIVTFRCIFVFICNKLRIISWILELNLKAYFWIWFQIQS